MSEPIYTDKDYLDAQFLNVQLRLDALAKAQTKRMDDHDEWHRRWGKRFLSVVIALLTGGFIAWPKP